MKKILIGAAIAVVVFGVFGAAGYVYAQATTPTATYPGYGVMGGRGGMMGGRGGMMGNRTNENQDGYMHDEMVAAFAEKLGMSATDLEARLDKGETMYQVAESKGITGDQFTTLMTEARTVALDQAVKNGSITQEQADWMKQRGVGTGYSRGMMGRGQNSRSGCPYLDNDGDE
jgi:hypothetical protein